MWVGLVRRWAGARSTLTASSLSVLRAESATAVAVAVVSCQFEEDVRGPGRLQATVNGVEAVLYG